MKSCFFDLRLYDDGSVIVTASDADGQIPDYKRFYVGESQAIGMRCLRNLSMGLNCNVVGCEFQGRCKK